MGLFDKVKDLGSKALDGAQSAANTVMDKTGITEKQNQKQKYDLAFATKEDIRQNYLAGLELRNGIAGMAVDYIRDKSDKSVVQTFGSSLPGQEYIDEFVNTHVKVQLTEEQIEENIEKIFQDRKAAQAELLEMWKNSTNPEEQTMYEKYKDEEIWIR